MRGCPELRKLPKAPGISSLHFRRKTPGSAASASFSGPSAKNRLDPQHPIDLIRGKQKAFVWAHNTPFFSLGALPMGLLANPAPLPRFESIPFDSWAARVARGAESRSVAPMLLNDQRPNRLSVSLQLASTADRRIHQRVQILRRFKTALNLIATRAAVVQQVKGRLKLIFDDTETADECILQGWTYFLRPTLELYRMPYPELVGHLRPMLRDIWTRATAMEAQWAAATIGQRAPRSWDSSGGPTSHAPSSERHPKSYGQSPDWQQMRAGRVPDRRSSASPSNQRPRRDDTPTSSQQRLQTQASDSRGSSEPRVADAQGSFAARSTVRLALGLRTDGPPRTTARDPSTPQLQRRQPRDTLPAVPTFDPFPSVRGGPSRADKHPHTTAREPEVSAVLNRRQTLDPLPPEPVFDPFPSVRASPGPLVASKGGDSPRLASGPSTDFEDVSLPALPDFDPFPTTPAPTVSPSASAPPPSLSAPTPAKKPDWWAIGRTIEAGVGQVAEGATQWDRPGAAERAPKEPEPLQSRVKDMLYRRTVVRPDEKARTAGTIPWQTHRFEEK
ncbi:hypothetical protein DFH09DRAFT_466694 [Mycena vulgaris]|nr:hypothetical protein DFH09DRAFT_466694 [Mycena vulgaris]